MRRAWSPLVAAFVLAASGCLSSIIPEHHASSSSDAGAASGAGDNPTQTGTGGNAVDAGSGSDGGGDGGVPQVANDPNCIAKAAAVIDGHHNAGQPCLQCHDGNTAGANKFTAAGTVYDKLSLAAG